MTGRVLPQDSGLEALSDRLRQVRSPREFFSGLLGTATGQLFHLIPSPVALETDLRGQKRPLQLNVEQKPGIVVVVQDSIARQERDPRGVFILNRSD